MASLKRTSLFHRLICLFMALHVINLSLDAPNRYEFGVGSSDGRSNLVMAEIESFGELLLKYALDQADSQSEQAEQEETSDFAPIGPDFFYHQPFAFSLQPDCWAVTSLRFSSGSDGLPSPISEIVAPPPQPVARA